jgi:hypothetical protein
MSTEKHFCVEQLEDGQYAVHEKGAKRVGKIVDTQRKAIDTVHELNPDNREKDALRRKPGRSEIAGSAQLRQPKSQLSLQPATDPRRES